MASMTTPTAGWSRPQPGWPLPLLVLNTDGMSSVKLLCAHFSFSPSWGCKSTFSLFCILNQHMAAVPSSSNLYIQTTWLVSTLRQFLPTSVAGGAPCLLTTVCLLINSSEAFPPSVPGEGSLTQHCQVFAKKPEGEPEHPLLGRYPFQLLGPQGVQGPMTVLNSMMRHWSTLDCSRKSIFFLWLPHCKNCKPPCPKMPPSPAHCEN